MSSIIPLAALALLSPLTAQALDSSWLDDPQVRRELDAGGTVLHSNPGAAAEGEGIRVDAAIKINADREVIWRVLKDCDHAASFIPGLKRCHATWSAADGSAQILEHEMRYSWLLPTIRSVFRADYQRPYRIDFRRISGDMKEEHGAWLLEPAAEGGATIIEYQLYVDPGFWVPGAITRHWINKELPAALTALRARAEQLLAER